MRLVHFDFNNNFGGAPQSMIDLARRLGERHEVHIVDAYGKCEPYHAAIVKAKLPCHVVMPHAKHRFIGHHGFKRLWATVLQLPELLRLRARLAATIGKISPDAIWVMNEKSLLFVCLCNSLRRIPIAYAVRGWATRNQLGVRLRYLLRHRVAAVMAVSTATLKQLHLAGVPKKRLHLISSTLDTGAVLSQSKSPLLSPLPGMDRLPRLLMMAARPEKDKGHLAALRTVARLVRAGNNPVLWIPGQAPVGSDNSYLEALDRKCQELDIKDHVYFLGWREDMPQLIIASDICLLPSHTEGLPRSVLEAMLLRRPVIATGVGGIPDAIKDGVTGHLMAIDDAEAMARHIERLTADDEHREKIVEAAYDHLAQNFDSEVHTRKVESIFRSIVS